MNQSKDIILSPMVIDPIKVAQSGGNLLDIINDQVDRSIEIDAEKKEARLD